MKVILLASVLLGSFVIAASADDGSRDAEVAVSYFDGLAANWAALRTFDLLLEEDTFRSTNRVDSTEISGKYRLVADLEKDRYLFVYSGYQETGSIAESVRGRGLKAFYLDGASREAWMTELSKGRPEKIAIKEQSHFTHAALALSGFPEVRLVGSYEFPHAAFPNYSVDQAFNADFHDGKQMSLRAMGKDTVRITVDSNYGTKARFRRTYDFDTNKLVPKSLSHEFSRPDGTNASIVRKEAISWVGKKGVFLPEKISCERLLRKAGGKIAVPEFTDASFSWLSVNESIDPERLDLQLIREPKQLLKLVDPDLIEMKQE